MVAAVAGIALALSTIRAIIRLHGRVDGILATKTAADDLPFALLSGPIIAPGTIFDADDFFFDPAPPANRIKPLENVPAQHRDAFALVCKIEGLDTLAANRTGKPLTGLSQTDKERFQFAKTRIERIASGNPVTDNAVLAQTDALAYYAVSSARLSNNPAYARLLIATADTLLEVVGENASLLISDPRTAGVIGTLVQEFSGGTDFDDANAGLIFRKLLFATAVTLETHRDLAGNDRVARAFIAALTDIRTNPPKDAEGNALDGDELVAEILTRGGVERLLSTFLTRLADDPHFSQTDDALRKTVGDVLREVAEILPGGITSQEGLAIAEIAIAGIAGDLQNRLEKRYAVNGKSLSIGGYVLTILVQQIRSKAAEGTLANDILTRNVVGELYRAILTGFLQRPELIARHAGNDAAMQAYVGELVAGILPLLSDDTDFRNTVGPTLLPRVLGIALSVTADHAAILTGQNGYATKIVEAALLTAAPLIQDGLSREELVTILDAAIKAAADNLNLARMSDNLRPIAQAFASALKGQSIASLSTRENRIAIAKAFLTSLVDNPLAWDRLGGKIGQGPTTIIQPLLQGLAVGIAQEGGPDWSGPAMQDAIRRALGAALGQVDLLIDQKIDEAVLQAFAQSAVETGRDIVAKSPGLGPEAIPRLLEGAISGFLAAVAADPALLGTKDAFAKAMIAASFATAAPLIQDGLTRQELSAIVKTAYDTARNNTDLITMPDLLRPVAEAFAAALSPSALATIGDTAGRQAIALVFLRSLEQNPATWAALEPHAGPALTAMLQPLYSGSVAAFAAHSSGLLAGPLLALAVRQALTAGLPFADIWIGGKVSEAILQQTLRGALAAFEQANNAALAPALAPRFAGLVLRQALIEAIALPDAAAVAAHLTPPRIKAIAETILTGLNT